MVLPSKKILSLFVLTTAFVASVIIVFDKERGDNPINFTSSLGVGEKVSIPENPNWQNEISKISNNTTPSEVQASQDTPQTTTDVVSIALVSNYLTLKQSDALDQNSAQKLVGQIADYATRPEVGTKKISLSDIKTITNNSKQSIYEYGDSLGSILKQNRLTEPKDEILILQEVMDQKDPLKISELQEITDVYQNIADQMFAMKVPYVFIEAHIDMLNGVFGIAHNLKQLQNVLTDPLQSLQNLQNYKNSGDLFIQALYASKEFVNKNNVVYKQGSGGYYLIYGI